MAATNQVTAIPGTSPEQRWTETPAALHFRFGYLALYSWRFRALTLDIPFVAAREPNVESHLPLGRVRGKLKALIAPLPLGPDDADLPKLTRTREWLRYVPATRVNYLLELDGTFAGYLKALPAKARHEMTRKVRKFAALTGEQDISIHEYRTPAEVDEFQRSAHAVSKKTYQFRLLKLGIPATGEFRSKLIELASADRLRGYVLFLGNSPVAFGFCRVHHDVLEYDQTGYDPTVSELSGGIVLLYGLLRSVFAEGRFSSFDFGFGEAQWKRMYGSGSVRYASAYYFRPGFVNEFFIRAHMYATGCSDFAGQVMSNLGIKERFKALLRRGAAPKSGKTVPAGEKP